ncbi:MAG: hypothetical protein IKD80_06125, partial [Selenomonadaceae bacterium]|nr:hypothetical protein [Selenomonadaceae bacterium]
VTAGTVQGGGSTNPVMVLGYTVTESVGDITVGLNGASAFVGGLDNEEIFYVGSISYQMTAAGITKNGGDKLVYEKSTYDGNNGMFYLANESPVNIINVSGTSLGLRGKTEDAFVYNANNTTKFGALSFVGSDDMTLTSDSSKNPKNSSKIFTSTRARHLPSTSARRSMRRRVPSPSTKTRIMQSATSSSARLKTTAHFTAAQSA